jgi:hypothetical protein
MSLDRIEITLDTVNLSDDLIVINRVLVDGASIAAVAVGKETNFQALMANLEANSGGSRRASGNSIYRVGNEIHCRSI